MKNWMKVLLTIVLLGVIVVIVSYGMSKNDSDINVSYEKLDVATLSGPTGFGLAYLFDDENYNVTVYDAPDQVSAGLIKGEIMFATIPTNMAAILNNKTNGKIKILSVIAEGNLYILTTRDDITDIESLRDKTIALSGKGATPEVIATDLFKNYNVNFEYKSEHAEVVALMKAGKVDVIMLPEPYVTIAMKQIEGVKVALSIDEIWNNKYNKLGLPMGSLVMNTDYFNDIDALKQSEEDEVKNEELTSNLVDDTNKLKEARVEKLLKDVASSIKNVNKNIKESSLLIEEKEIIKVKDVAIDAIENCNIVYINADDAKDMLNNYFKVINESNAKLIGGKVPNEEIYY